MTLYTVKPKDSTQILLEAVNKFTKLHDAKPTNKNQLHFYTLARNNPKKKIHKTVRFNIALKRIKYLGINLAKEVKVLYTENYKIVLNKTKEHK